MTYLSLFAVKPNPQFEEIWNSVLENCYSFSDKQEELKNIFRRTTLSIHEIFTIREKTKSFQYIPQKNEAELIHLFVEGIKFKCSILLNSFNHHLENLSWYHINFYLQNFPNSLHKKLEKRLSADSIQKAIASSNGKDWVPILTQLIQKERIAIFKALWDAFPPFLREEICQSFPFFFNTAIKSSPDITKEFLYNFDSKKHPKLYPEKTWDDSPLRNALATQNPFTIQWLLQCNHLTYLQLYGEEGATVSSLFHCTLPLYGKKLAPILNAFTYCLLFSEEPEPLISKTLSYQIIHRFLGENTPKPIKDAFEIMPYINTYYVWSDFISKWLLLAIQRGHEITVNLIFQNCTKENLPALYKVDESNQTLLHHAVLSKNKQIIATVFKHAVDISSLFTLNNKNQSIFHLAINDLEILSLLFTYYPPKCHIPSFVHLADAYARKAMKKHDNAEALISLHSIVEYFLNSKDIKEYIKLAFTFPKLSLYLFSYHASFAIKFLEALSNQFTIPTRVLVECIPFFPIKLIRRLMNKQREAVEEALMHIDIKKIAFKLCFELLTLFPPEAIVDTVKNVYSRKRTDLLNRTASIDYGIPFKNQAGRFYNEKVTIIMDEISKNRLATLENEENYEILLHEIQNFFNGLEPLQLAIIASSFPELVKEFLPFFTDTQTIVTFPLLHKNTLSLLCELDTSSERILRYFKAASLEQKLYFLKKQNYITNITLKDWIETRPFLSKALKTIRPLKPSLMRNNMILDIKEQKFANYMTDHYAILAKQFIQSFSQAAISKSCSNELKTLLDEQVKTASEKFDRINKEIIHFRETINTLQLCSKNEIPEKFFDALLYNVMKNPILLPYMGDNKMYIDETTLNILPTSIKTVESNGLKMTVDCVRHPFDNKDYPRDAYVLDLSLKGEIEKWKQGALLI